MTDAPAQHDVDEDDDQPGRDEAGKRGRWDLVWRRFRKDVLRRRRKLAAGMGFSIVVGLAKVAEPWPLKIVFDQVLFHRPAHGWLTRAFLVFGGHPTDILAAAAVALVAAGLVHGVAYYHQDYMLASAAQEIVYAIRTRLYRHLHSLPLSFHVTRQVGDTLVRLSADVILLRDVLIDFIVNLGSGIVMLVLMLTVMVLVDPVLTLLAVATMPAAFVITWVYGDQIRIRSRKQRKREGEVGALMHESLAAMSVVQLHGAEERELERFRAANKRSLSQGTKTVRLEAKMNRAIEIALACGMVVVLWVGTLRAIHGHISPGELVVFISYLRAAYRPLRRASKTVQRSAKALAAAERIAELLAIEPSIRDAPDARALPPLASELRFDNVAFAYNEQREVLCDIQLMLPAGRHLAVVGPTGSGKSTLLRLVPRLYDPTAGRVLFDGTDIRGGTLASVRGQVAMVEQESVLMGATIAQNIRYGRPDASDAQVAAAAEASGLALALARLPDGLDTQVAERGASLSGGERQRVAIARALIREAPLLLLDEPTTGLDPTTKRGVIDAIETLLEGRTSIIVTHDLELARRADEIALLVDGHVTMQGSYDELMQSSQVFRELARSLEEEAAR
jgi:ABC-type multidrug transport system fused ATPase/permease subunit